LTLGASFLFFAVAILPFGFRFFFTDSVFFFLFFVFSRDGEEEEEDGEEEDEEEEEELDDKDDEELEEEEELEDDLDDDEEEDSEEEEEDDSSSIHWSGFFFSAGRDEDMDLNVRERISFNSRHRGQCVFVLVVMMDLVTQQISSATTPADSPYLSTSFLNPPTFDFVVKIRTFSTSGQYVE